MRNPINAQTAILRYLDLCPGYGKDLAEQINIQTNGMIKLTLSSVYPALRELEEKGFVFRESREGRAEIFKITTNGKKEAAKERKAIALLFGFSN